jgi:hypothetical protein
MHDTGSEVAAPSRARFASIAAFSRSLRLSHAPTQLHQPRCDYALRPAPTRSCLLLSQRRKRKPTTAIRTSRTGNEVITLMQVGNAATAYLVMEQMSASKLDAITASSDDAPGTPGELALFEPYESPAGGWGALQATAKSLREQSVVLNGGKALLSITNLKGSTAPDAHGRIRNTQAPLSSARTARRRWPSS